MYTTQASTLHNTLVFSMIYNKHKIYITKEDNIVYNYISFMKIVINSNSSLVTLLPNYLTSITLMQLREATNVSLPPFCSS